MDIRIAQNESDSKAASYIYAMSWKSGYKGIFTEELLEGISTDFWVNSFNRNYETHRFEVALMNVKGQDIMGFERQFSSKEILRKIWI